ncbi:MAG: low molecular weight protein arginine phosphatase [Clostridia bacterium]|nr:low molecular weight protein arginine phosphatase [Clostridia bacterium]
MAKARAAKRKKKILFVCTGNTCRSPMAENLFRYILGKKRKLSLYDVSSAGLAAEAGAPMTENALLALAARGAAPRRKHAAQQLTVQAAAQADGIVCMTASHKAALAALGDKVKTVGEITGGPDVPDPFGGDLAVYNKTAEYLLYACEDIYAWAQTL